MTRTHLITIIKGKGFPYSIPSVGPGADPGVQAVSPQVTVSHPPGGRLPLLSARPAVTSPAAEHHRPLASTKLYCLVTEAHRCKQLAQGCYAALSRVGFEPATYWSQVQRSTVTLPRHLNNLITINKLECGPMPNLMVAMPNIGGALCSTPQSLADAHY